MAKVTSFTADRMLEIEATTIVDGEINGAGHLILRQRNGFTIDAGTVTGPPGEGVLSVTVQYQASASGTVEPSTWQNTIPIVPAGWFLWSRTVTTYRDPEDPEGTFSTNTFTVTQQPLPGEPGKGIQSTAIDYQVGTSGVEAPTGTWQSNPPEVPPNQYLWTRIYTLFTDDSNTTAYTVAKSGGNGTPGPPGSSSYLHVAYANSEDGTVDFDIGNPSGRMYMGVYVDGESADSTDPSDYAWSKIQGASGAGIQNSSVRYQSSTSGTVTPTGAWSTTIPVVAPGDFLWTRTVLNFTDGASQTTYTVAKQGENGADGAQGDSVISQERFYLLSDTVPDAPSTVNPGPWSSEEPGYDLSTTDILYSVLRTIKTNGPSSTTFSWGAVQVDSNYQAARDVYQASQTTSEEIRHIADGADQKAQNLADAVLTTDEEGVPRIADALVTRDSMAFDAIDFMSAKGLQLESAKIRSPDIASSDNLGSGANALTDPEFQSTINTAWVASGHLGDAARTQRDTYNWDQTYSQKQLFGGYSVKRHIGSSHVDLVLTPAARKCGSLVFANYRWMFASRSLNNPFTFTNRHEWLDSYLGGKMDPSWGAPAVPTPLAGVSLTTYLTNSATIPIVIGQLWNAKFTFTRLTASNTGFVTLTLEVINAATNAVLWSRVATADEKLTGKIDASWTSTFTGNVKYRIKSVYTAGGGTAVRRPFTGGFARVLEDNVQQTRWDQAPDDYIPYKSYIQNSSIPGYTTLGTDSAAVAISNRATFQVIGISAQFSQVQPQKGWRLTEDGGFELFNTSGNRTGALNGEDNFLNGNFSTKESGHRAGMLGEKFFVTNGLGQEIGQFYSDGLRSIIRVHDLFMHSDLPWAQAFASTSTPTFPTTRGSLRNGWMNVVNANWDGFQSIKRLGETTINGAINKSTGYASLEVVAWLPEALRPEVPSYIPASYGTSGSYLLARPNGDIVTVQSGSAGQITFSGKLIPLPT